MMEEKWMSEVRAEGVPTEPRTGRRRALAGLAAVSVAALGAASMQREAHAGPMGFGHHGHGGWHGGMGPMDPATMGKRIEAMVALMLADIDVTPEQRERIVAIAKGVATDMESSREQHMKLRRESLQLFAAPTIDATALEKLRAEQMKLGEAASRRMLAAMIEGAKVLNPEQRAKLVERRQRRMPPPR
jgi:Spy/CpxP family protein refolding chaperone